MHSFHCSINLIFLVCTIISFLPIVIMASPTHVVDSNDKENSDLSVPQLNVKFQPIPKTQLESFKKVFTAYKDGLVRSDPGGFVMVPRYGANAERIYQIKPRRDDVWLLTFPKTGGTWVSEMLWLIMNNCDYETAFKKQLIERTFFPEMSYLTPLKEGDPEPIPFYIQIEKEPSPRVIKPHLPFYLLNPELLDTAKVVYVARNPKDVIVSFYFHHRYLVKLQGCEAPIDEFAQYFMDDEVIYAPFFPHVLDAWNKRHHPNMYFIFYEDLKKNLRKEIEKMANFLGKELTEDQIDRLNQHLKFENIQKNDAVNNERYRKAGMSDNEGKFIRKGKVGDWKNYFNPEMNRKIDLWIEKNLAGTDLKFSFELDEQE